MHRFLDVMLDCEGNEVEPGDYVQLPEGKPSYINGNMKKGQVFILHKIEDRSIYENEKLIVGFLRYKNGSTRVLSSSITSKEILKVNYDVKNKKIVKGEKNESII